MSKTIVKILLALLSPAIAKESIDKSIDAVVDRLSTGSSLQEPNIDLDNTMLGKTASQLAIPSSRVASQRLPNVAARAVATGGRRQGAPVMAPPSREPRGSGVSERESTQQHVDKVPPAETEASIAEILGMHRSEAGNTKKIVEILEARAEANRAAAAAKPPYDLKIYVKGDMANYPHDFENYAEHKVEDALANYQDHIQAVDLRMVAEGHKPMLYRFEVTVKSDMPGATIVSKSKHAHATFNEAIDDMHDTLKRNVLREKEKRITKKRSAKAQHGKDTLYAPDPSEDIAESGDEQYDYDPDMEWARQEP